jgi:hypothetical protein
MRQNSFISTAIIAILSIILFSCGNGRDEQLNKTSFDNYKNAIIHDNGKEAVKYVDTRTIKYYSRLLELTKTADSLQIEKSPIIEKFFVLTVRHTTPKDSILSFTGETLFAYAIEKGMTGKESAPQLYIDHIDIENDFAVVEVKSKDAKSEPGIKINYYKENGAWKADWTSFFAVGNVAFKNLIKSSGMEENEFIMRALTEIYGKQNNNAWNPLI